MRSSPADGPLVLAIDQGTTGTTAAVTTADGRVLGRSTQEFPQHFPRPGWVEHDPDELFQSVLVACNRALAGVPSARERLAALGLTNQRETILLWERDTGRPLSRALVWQDRRTAERCQALRAAGHGERVRELTGLVIDPYFSATKLAWLLDSQPGLRGRAERGELCFGTVDSYLVRRLAGAEAPHVMDVTNASRTLLMDLTRRAFSSELCALFEVPEACLPRLVASSGEVARTASVPGLPDGIPISGIAGDQHAALFGQGCFAIGEAKCTYGTGAFVLVNTGPRPVMSSSGLLTTLAWQVGDEVCYALEGSCFIAGAAVQWLRDGLGIIARADQLETLARSVPDSAGVVFVPALAGLGAPHWDAGATGLITGLTRGTTRAHLARATLEAIALEVDDLLTAMSADLGRAGLPSVKRLRVDGGAAANDLLLELQAGLSALEVERPADVESTVRGAALLAAVGAGLLHGLAEVSERLPVARRFGVAGSPECLDAVERAAQKARWQDAVRRARTS